MNVKSQKMAKHPSISPKRIIIPQKTRHNGHKTSKALQAKISALEVKLENGFTVPKTSPIFDELCAIIVSALVPAPTGTHIPRTTATKPHNISTLAIQKVFKRKRSNE